MFSVDGLATGLDTTRIIEGMVSLQNRQVEQLGARKQGISAEQTAFKGIEARMLELRAQLGALGRSQDSIFSSRSATSSSPDSLEVTAKSGAAAGVYNLRINSLAQAEQRASQGFASPDATIAEGTLTFRVGSGKAATITVDSTNNTLQGLADAINAVGGEVRASLLNDGSSDGSPYKLLLTSNKTGAANAIVVTNNLAAGPDQPDFSGDPVQQASDAHVTLGSGAGAVNVTSSKNQLDNLISGVTLDLRAADPTKQISVSVSANTATAVNAVQQFVESFNGLMDFIDEQIRFEPQSGQASVLLGSRAAMGIQDEVRRIATSVVAGVNTDVNRLSTLGISVTDRGRLLLNSSRLTGALNGDIPGASEADFRRLFALDGASTNAGIRFLLGSTRTQESTEPIGVDISQAAERATITASSPLAATTVIDASNNEFTFTLDGAASSTLTLAEGTYTRQELADQFQAVLNAATDFKGRSVRVTLDNDALRVTSDSYGLASEVAIGSGGTALGALGFAGTEADKGQDVVGKFIVNGVDEPAVGTGRILAGDPKNPNTADLRIQVTLTSSQVSAGIDGEMTITRGIASKLDKLLGALLDPVTGRMKTISNGFDKRIEAIEKTLERRNALIESKKESLLRQFAALEGNVGQLQATGNFLTAQLAALNAVRR